MLYLNMHNMHNRCTICTGVKTFIKRIRPHKSPPTTTHTHAHTQAQAHTAPPPSSSRTPPSEAAWCVLAELYRTAGGQPLVDDMSREVYTRHVARCEGTLRALSLLAQHREDEAYDLLSECYDVCGAWGRIPSFFPLLHFPLVFSVSFPFQSPLSFPFHPLPPLFLFTPSPLFPFSHTHHPSLFTQDKDQWPVSSLLSFTQPSAAEEDFWWDARMQSLAALGEWKVLLWCGVVVWSCGILRVCTCTRRIRVVAWNIHKA